ncbi:MAG: hypothetical protein OEV76_11200, partial [Anaerolineae bacterium]|nr:hypothetical protein [Anaerolineae bacterium]
DITGICINSEPGSREALRQQIMARLPEIVDPETNQPVVRWMHRGEDCYRGPYAEGIPDIIVGLDPDYGWGYQVSHYGSTVTRVAAVSRRGHHRLEGIFIAAGPNVVSRAEAHEGLSIQDIAPTVLHIMGLPIPSDMDGRVLTEILAPAFLESWPIKKGEPIGLWPDEAKASFSEEIISDEDEEQIRTRLDALGYLG